MKHISKLLLPLALCLYACARQGVPTGGPKDTTPPGIDTLASTPNYTTRINPKRIALKFDEWVVLSEAAAQVVVSPPLAKRPEVLLQGRTVVVKFDAAEKFRENTTYTINFGTAVKDLHEGNPAKDLRFVFSTGDFIDSLSIRGRVADAFSGEPVENVAVMLYDDMRDTVVRKERPYYFSRTDKTGAYEIRNVKSGNFKLAAVEDLDQNLRWDGEGERIGFLDSTLVISDSLTGLAQVLLFKNPSKFRITEKNTDGYGVVRLKFSSSTDSANVLAAPMQGLKLLMEKMQDSMLVWYDLEAPATWNLYVNQDTIAVKTRSREDFIAKHSLRFAGEAVAVAPGGRKQQQPAPAPAVVPSIKTVSQNPGKPAIFAFNFPVISADTAKWVLRADSVRVFNFNIKTDSLAPRQCTLEHPWSPGKTYTLEILPGAVTDFWSQNNQDTLRRILGVPNEKQLGNLNLSVEKMRSGVSYIVQLLNGARIEESRVFIAERETTKLTFAKLEVATYTARLIEDRNANGKWDTGDYWKHRQPEAVVTKKLEALRANWELEASISLLPENDKGRGRGK
jgi:Bacterial Ig-like domain/Carboxypeptidase regulatory-like domain